MQERGPLTPGRDLRRNDGLQERVLQRCVGHRRRCVPKREHAARSLAEAHGWPAVTMRRIAGELGVTEPVMYSAFAGRQALIDAVALSGFDDIASALEAAEASPMPRLRARLDFAAAHPGVYEAMFSLPSGLAFAAVDTPNRYSVPSRGSATHSRTPTALERRSPGQHCMAGRPSRPADGYVRARRRLDSNSCTACSPESRPADGHPVTAGDPCV
jgi:AcrR family transcriptional regulator